MLKKRLIPIVLLKNGWVVQSKLFKEYQNLGNPLQTVKRLSEWCSDELIYLDISKDNNYDIKRNDQNYPNRKNFIEIISDVSKVSFMPLTVGGKIKNLNDIELRLKEGADKVSINTYAFRDKKFIKYAAKEFGSQCIVISIDVKKINNNYKVFVNGGEENTERDSISWSKEVEDLGAGEILLNFIDRDGQGKGYDIEFTNKFKENLKIPLILCGGAGNENDFYNAVKKTDVDAIAAANFFHYKDQSVYYTKKFLYEKNLNFRKPDLIDL
tara:strand:- start:3424 stop:4230 length:807 start_codon:yes stop_codon:yes gene_type:complete